MRAAQRLMPQSVQPCALHLLTAALADIQRAKRPGFPVRLTEFSWLAAETVC